MVSGQSLENRVSIFLGAFHVFSVFLEERPKKVKCLTDKNELCRKDEMRVRVPQAFLNGKMVSLPGAARFARRARRGVDFDIALGRRRALLGRWIPLSDAFGLVNLLFNKRRLGDHSGFALLDPLASAIAFVVGARGRSGG